MASKARGDASAAPTTTSPPKLCPTATTGPPPVGRVPQLVHHGQQVVDMAAQIHDPAAPRSLVPAPVVGDGRELGQPAHHPPEALAPVERAVHEDHRGRARLRAPGRARTWRAVG